MADLSEPQMGELPATQAHTVASRRAALYAELAVLHADKAAIESRIQRVMAELEGNLPDWRDMVAFTKGD